MTPMSTCRVLFLESTVSALLFETPIHLITIPGQDIRDSVIAVSPYPRADGEPECFGLEYFAGTFARFVARKVLAFPHAHLIWRFNPAYFKTGFCNPLCELFIAGSCGTRQSSPHGLVGMI
jgi:hypothetical protein